MTANQVAEQLLNVFVLRVRDMRAIVPHAAAFFFAVDVAAIVRIGLINEAFLGTKMVANRQPADARAKNCNVVHSPLSSMIELSMTCRKVEKRLPTIKPFCVSARRPRLDAAQSEQRQECIFGEPMPILLRLEALGDLLSFAP
jgi:hypothetical protein